MLYYRDSFNYHVNLAIVRRWRTQLLRTELGIRLARTLFGESEKDLRQHTELVRQDPHSYVEAENLLNRNTDGPDNPLSQVFSKQSAERMFCQFRRVKTSIMFWNPKRLSGIGKLLLLVVEDWLASHWGWHLWVHAQQSPVDFAGLKAVPQPERGVASRALVPIHEFVA